MGPLLPSERESVFGKGTALTHLLEDLHHLLDVGVVNLSLQPVGVIRVSERAGGPREELDETNSPQGVGNMRTPSQNPLWLACIYVWSGNQPER